MHYKLKGLQSLRFIAASMIFLSHCPSLLPFDITGLGSAGVTIFILLSGFLAVYNNNPQSYKNRYTLQESITYCKKKLNKFYLLHILTFLFSLLLLVGGAFISGRRINALDESMNAVLNILLLQSYVPKETVFYSFNAVSWYLSTTMFFYFITPLVLRGIVKLKNLSNKLAVILAIYAVQIVYTLLFASSGFAKGFIYINPLFRSLEFIMGCLIGNIFVSLNNIAKEEKQKVKNSLLQIFAIFAFIAALLLAKNIPVLFQYCIYFIPVSCMLIYLFANCEWGYQRYVQIGCLYTLEI